MNLNRLGKLNKLVTNDLKRKPTIILEPNSEQSYRISGTANDLCIGIDTDDWVISDELKSFINELGEGNISDEEKILKIYQKLCEDYTYDDNVLSYIKKNDDDTFYLPDEYGRKADSIWRKNRKKHNRRNCFEVARILAKSIKFLDHSKKYDVCIIWDEANTHYLVGIACNEYCALLDLDDFTQIKDLTRVKTGLTIEGIKILEDPYDKFGPVLEKLNESRGKIAKDYIEEKREKSNKKNNENSEEIETSENDNIDSDDISFLQYTVQILKEDYNLDSAGIYEFLKEVVDTKIGVRFRKKVWMEVENEPGVGTRYTRCLIVYIDDIPYIIDVTKDNPEEIFRQFDEKELEDTNSKIIRFKEMFRNWKEDPYDGR